MFKDLIPWYKKESEHPIMSLRKGMDQLFENFFQGFPEMWPSSLEKTDFVPRMDVAETDKEIQITAELPGMTEKDIEVNLQDNVLTIKGEKREEEEKKDKNYHCVERRYGSFYRSIPISKQVEVDKTDAKFKNGILTITMPKTSSPEQGTKIQIKSE